MWSKADSPEDGNGLEKGHIVLAEKSDEVPMSRTMTTSFEEKPSLEKRFSYPQQQSTMNHSITHSIASKKIYIMKNQLTPAHKQ